MDQVKITLPHFRSPVKLQRRHGIAVHLIGLLRQRLVNNLCIFTMEDEHTTRDNNVIVSIYLLSNEIKSTDGALPDSFFPQLDKGWTENENT